MNESQLKKLFAKVEDGAVVELPLEVVPEDGPAQLRVNKTEQATAQRYADQMKEGIEFDPAHIFWDGRKIHLADGYHRRLAHAINGVSTIACILHRGTQEDAVVYAVKAHREQKGYSNDDKRNAVLAITAMERYKDSTDKKISQICGVSQPFVGKVKKDPSYNGYKMDTERTVERGGKTYTMNVANIGRKPTNGAMTLPELAALAKQGDEAIRRLVDSSIEMGNIIIEVREVLKDETKPECSFERFVECELEIDPARAPQYIALAEASAQGKPFLELRALTYRALGLDALPVEETEPVPA